MPEPLQTFIPCPVCYDIGGGGHLQQWTLPDLPTFLVCEECNTAWEDPDDLTWQTGELFHTKVERLGWNSRAADVAAVRTEPKLFCVPEEDLRQQVSHVLHHGQLVRPAEGRVHYRQLRLDPALGCRGEQVLVVLTAPGILVAFPSRHEVDADFHYW